MIATPIENLKTNVFSWSQELHTLIIKAQKFKFNLVFLYILYNNFLKNLIYSCNAHMCGLFVLFMGFPEGISDNK